MGPERKGLEFGVGLFIIIGLACLAYLSFTLGNIGLGKHSYVIKAVFPTVAGLKTRAEVTMAGVSIGEVKDIRLKDDRAEVIMSINKNVKLEDDSIASIKPWASSGINMSRYRRGLPILILKTMESSGRRSLPSI